MVMNESVGYGDIVRRVRELLEYNISIRLRKSQLSQRVTYVNQTIIVVLVMIHVG